MKFLAGAPYSMSSETEALNFQYLEQETLQNVN